MTLGSRAPDGVVIDETIGQPTCSGFAMLTGLSLRAVFRLALRQTRGTVKQ